MMKTVSFKKIVLSLLIVLTILGMAYYQTEVFAAEKLTIQSPPIMAALPFLWMQDEGKLDGIVDLEVKISPDHKRALALIAKDEIDMMITGLNVGAKVYNKGIDLKLMNVNTWAVDYLLTYDFKAESWEDLKGKTLALPLKGGPLDFLARYLLIENDVNLDEIDFVYRPLPNAAKYFMAGKLDSIILPEPLVTVNMINNKKAHLSLDIQKEWGKLHEEDNRIPFVGLFVSGNYLKENREISKIINGMYLKGIEWVNENPEAAAKLASKYFAMPAKVLQTAFKRVDLNYYSEGDTEKLINEYFSEILNMYPEMLGGNMPDEGFYF